MRIRIRKRINKRLKVLEGIINDLKKEKEERDKKEKEEKRQEKIKTLSYDFDIPEERLKGETMEKLLEYEEILETALKRSYDDLSEKERLEDEKSFEMIRKRMHDKYFLEV